MLAVTGVHLTGGRVIPKYVMAADHFRSVVLENSEIF